MKKVRYRIIQNRLANDTFVFYIQVKGFWRWRTIKKGFSFREAETYAQEHNKRRKDTKVVKSEVVYHLLDV